MDDLYASLGVKSSATPDEIRRAYRVLARRYHPDVNPGRKSEELFKKIAHAYSVLEDAESRRKYDAERTRLQSGTAGSQADPDTARRRYHEAQRRAEAARAHAEAVHSRTRRRMRIDIPPEPEGALSRAGSWLKDKVIGKKAAPKGKAVPSRRLSIVEVSISIQDSIRGIKKTIEVAELEGPRKVSVNIPPGAYTGSVIRFRETRGGGEELVLIARVAAHPYLSIEAKGLVVELPLTIGEALSGGKIAVPTLEDQVMLSVPPNTQGGTDLRLKGKGIVYRDGARGDLFFRVSIRIPDAANVPRTTVSDLERGYGGIRAHLPKTLG